MSKLHKILKRLCLTVAAIVLLGVVADSVFVLGFPMQSLPSVGEPVDAVVVLGAAPNSPAIRNRVMQGYAVYAGGYAKTIVLTGGNTSRKDESEAMNMARYLQAQKGSGLPLVLEERSTNTYENLLFAKVLIPDARRIAIVSDTYHTPRAFVTAKSLGFDDVYWSSPGSGYYRPGELVWYYLREMVAMVSYVPKWLRLSQ